MPTMTAPHPTGAVLTRGRQLVDAELRGAVATLPASVRLIAEYHLGWRDQTGKAATAPAGKAFRPTLALLAAEAAGGTTDAALPAAVAVELVHNHSLLHDDVIDGDRLRRHRPTAWAVFGVGPAILAGDAMLTLAFDVLRAGGGPRGGAALRLLGDAQQALVDGQMADLAFESRGDVRLEECMSMARAKTAALLGCSCALGVLSATGDERAIEHARAFGERLGLAFQLIDDILGIWGDPAVTGKPAHSDLQARKKSLPVVAALDVRHPGGAQARRALRPRRPALGPRGQDRRGARQGVRRAKLVRGRGCEAVRRRDRGAARLRRARAAGGRARGAGEDGDQP